MKTLNEARLPKKPRGLDAGAPDVGGAALNEARLPKKPRADRPCLWWCAARPSTKRGSRRSRGLGEWSRGGASPSLNEARLPKKPRVTQRSAKGVGAGPSTKRGSRRSRGTCTGHHLRRASSRPQRSAAPEEAAGWGLSTVRTCRSALNEARLPKKPRACTVESDSRTGKNGPQRSAAPEEAAGCPCRRRQ